MKKKKLPGLPRRLKTKARIRLTKKDMLPNDMSPEETKKLLGRMLYKFKVKAPNIWKEWMEIQNEFGEGLWESEQEYVEVLIDEMLEVIKSHHKPITFYRLLSISGKRMVDGHNERVDKWRKEHPEEISKTIKK